MSAHDFETIKQELADLRAKITAYDEQKSANEKVAGQIKEYRDFLENMTDRALKTFGIVIAITATAVTLIGVKSFLEITKNAQSAAQDRVKDYLSNHLIDSMIQERITEYQRAATIQYYETLASSPNSARIPPDAVLEKVLESTLTPAHRKYAADCAKIIGSYDYFSKDPEVSKRFGDLLLKLLTDSYGADSVMLEDGAQTAILDALGKLGRKDAGPTLWKLFKDDRAPDSYRMAFARNLPSLLSSEDLVRQIVNDMPRVKDHKGNSYAAELVAVLLANPNDKVGLQELQSLAKAQTWVYSDTTLAVIREVFSRTGRSFDSKESEESADFIAKNFLYPLVLSGQLYFSLGPRDPFRDLRMRAFQGRYGVTNSSMQPSFEVWVCTNESGNATGISGESFAKSQFFAAMLKAGIGDPNAANRAKVVVNVVRPLAEYLTAAKKDESRYYADQMYGDLEINSDLQLPEAKGQKIIRISISEVSKDTVELLAYPEANEMPIRIKRKTNNIDFSKLVFTQGFEE